MMRLARIRKAEVPPDGTKDRGLAESGIERRPEASLCRAIRRRSVVPDQAGKAVLFDGSGLFGLSRSPIYTYGEPPPRRFENQARGRWLHKHRMEARQLSAGLDRIPPHLSEAAESPRLFAFTGLELEKARVDVG